MKMTVAPVTEEENVKLQELRNIVTKIRGAKFNDGCLLRWLRAKDGDVAVAAKGLKKCATFRKAFGLNDLDTWHRPEVLAKYYGYGYPCCDREGSPVLLSLFGNNDFEGIMKSCQALDYIKVSLAHLEEGLAKADEIAKQKNEPYEQLVLIVDGENMTTAHYTFRPFTHSYLSLISTFQEYYPLVLKKVIVIRAPAMAQYAYSLLRPFLSEQIQQLVEMSADDWKERLFEIIDPEVWPAFWGGKREDNHRPLQPYASKMNYTVGPVPPACYYDSSSDKTKYEELTVYAGDKHIIELDVFAAGSIMYWKFKTRTEDIGFAIYFDPSDGESRNLASMEPVFPYFRLDCSQVPIEGSISCRSKGKYIVEFDNYYSWFSAKELSFLVRVLEPSLHFP